MASACTAASTAAEHVPHSYQLPCMWEICRLEEACSEASAPTTVNMSAEIVFYPLVQVEKKGKRAPPESPATAVLPGSDSQSVFAAIRDSLHPNTLQALAQVSPHSQYSTSSHTAHRANCPWYLHYSKYMHEGISCLPDLLKPCSPLFPVSLLPPHVACALRSPPGGGTPPPLPGH
jgi:hypothetical protein